MRKRRDGGGQWFLRFTIYDRRREIGLGSTEDVSLKEAREGSSKLRAVLRDGNDPIKERQCAKREA
ncbi:MAG: Arm DNA-binding domain-containing protein [Paracoccaceae bacterium]|nr:Arm DNA-binding domain-containing protein [Paracoccaceae bacterium]